MLLKVHNLSTIRFGFHYLLEIGQKTNRKTSSTRFKRTVELGKDGNRDATKNFIMKRDSPTVIEASRARNDNEKTRKTFCFSPAVPLLEEQNLSESREYPRISNNRICCDSVGSDQASNKFNTTSCSIGPYTLTLTAAELELFSLLRQFVTSTGLKTILRASGGWVRDKLLCKQTCDLDIALDDMTGVEFASKLNR